MNSSFSQPDLPIPQLDYLSNGLKVIHLQDVSNPLVCLQLYIRTGSLAERDSNRGYSHFIEHLVFKSTGLYPHNSISERATSLGGMINAFTDYDCTCFYLLLPKEALDEGLGMLYELAAMANFRRTDVEMEREVILEEIKQYENDPESDFLEYVQRNYFIRSPLKHPVLGYTQTVQSASHTSLKRYYKRHYQPQNAFMVICGDYDSTNLVSKLEQIFSPWLQTNCLPKNTLYLEPELNPPRRFARKSMDGSEYIALALPELSELHPLSDALLLAMRWLAIGKSCRLFKRLVEEDKLCSAVRVHSLCGIRSGASVIMIYPLGNQFYERILEIFRQELFHLLVHGIPAEALAEVKADVIHNWLFSFDGVENLANQIAAEEFIGDPLRISRYGEAIANITAAEILKAVNKYWQPRWISLFCEDKSCTFPDKEFRLSPSALPATKIYHSEPVPSIGPIISSIFKNPEIARLGAGHYVMHLPNGLKVVHKHIPHKAISGFSLSTSVSQISESAEQRGWNFFSTACMIHRSARYDHEALMRYSRAYGFNIRVIHHLDSTTFRGKCQATSLEKALALLGELISNPHIDKSHLRLLKATALDGIQRDNANPVTYAYQKWFDMLVGSGGNISRTAGKAADIRSVNPLKLEQWLARLSLPRDFCLGVVSSHIPEQIYAWANAYLGHDAKAREEFRCDPAWESSSMRYRKEYRSSDQAIIHLGSWATPAALSDDNTAFYVLAQIIGGESSSRFYDVIREKYGLAYQTGFDFSSIHSVGFWSAYSFCDKSDYRKCLQLMQDIIAEVAECGVSDAEVERAIAYLVGMNRFDMESPSYTASSMSNLAALGYPDTYYLSREQRLKDVSPTLVNKIANRWLQAKDIYTHILL